MDQPLRSAHPPSSEGDDLALLRSIAVGDRGAFDCLYRVYKLRLRRFLSQIVRQHHLIEEVLDDTMLAVWHKAHAFNGASRVSTWIFSIAYRNALKAVKRNTRLNSARVDVEDMVFADEPASRFAQREARERIRLALNILPPEQRTVVELTYYHGCGYREIAQIMGCPVDTVKTRMFHARRKLRALLDPVETGEL